MIEQIKTKKILWISLIILSMVSLIACEGNGDSHKKPETHASRDDTEINVPAEIDTLSGKVAETMNSGGYTYILLDRDGEKTWVAVPEMKVSEGEEVVLKSGIEMVNFTSKTLNRTFERVILSAGPVSGKCELVKKDMEMPHGDLPIGMIKAHAGSGMGIGTPINDVKVEKAAGRDAYTIAEVYKKKSDLCNNKVIVRGKVVKVLPEILGKNWIHLQDGSGDEKKGNYDLVVTSRDLPSLGDVITVSGTLYTDKDFGAGYKYNVIVEEASITK